MQYWNGSKSPFVMIGHPLDQDIYDDATRSKLTLKHRETHGCVVSTAATDALVLKHQVISIHNAD